MSRFTKRNYAVLAIFLLFIVGRLYGIARSFANSDAQRWHSRSEKFFEGLKRGDFKETYQRYHPGVTIMWISTITQVGIKLGADIAGVPYRSIGNVEGFILHDTVSKIMIISILAVLLVIQYQCITRLFGYRVALIFLVLMSVEPYLIGIDRWYHLTSLESYLSISALLLTLLWRKEKRSEYLVFAGILSGFALLTRFTSVIGLVVLVLLVFATLVRQARLPDIAKHLFLILAPVLLTVIILFPALWVAPGMVYSRLVEAGTNAVSGDYVTVAYAQRHALLFYLIVFAVKLNPVVLVVLLPAIYTALRAKEVNSITVALFFLVYLMAHSYSDQKIERYIILMIPAVMLVVASFLSQLTPRVTTAILLLNVLSCLVIYTKYYPYPAIYYSPVISGIKGAYALGLLDTNGEYYDKAAKYLNQKGRDVTAYVPNNLPSFTPFYKGKIKDDILKGPQYIIISIDSTRKEEEFPGCPLVEKTYEVDGVDYLTIRRCI